MTAQKNTLFLGTRKGLVVYRRKGGRWSLDQTHFIGIPVSYACADLRNGRWWACLDHGHWGCKLHFSDDEGTTWTETTAPAYPEGSEIKPGVPATLKYLWTFQPGSSAHPARVYAGTEPGGLFQSDDHGKSFQLVEALWNHPSRMEKWFGAGRDHPGVHSILVDPEDPEHIYVGVSVAGVFETQDGGHSWKPANNGTLAEYLPDPKAEVGQDPHLLVAHPRNFKHLWQQNHCGIYRSVDGGANWQDISQEGGPANFGFAIAVDEEDTETAFVVPAHSDQLRVALDGALCVSRTTDGGKSWSALRKGLPQEGVFDISYRHALDLTGDTVCFGSTTGNVFISGDKGDSWEVLANYLPLVYSVRFA